MHIDPRRMFLPFGVFQILMAYLFNTKNWLLHKGLMYRDYAEYVVGEGKENLVSVVTSHQMIVLNFLEGEEQALFGIRLDVLNALKDIQTQYHSQLYVQTSVDPCEAGDPNICVHIPACLDNVCRGNDFTRCVTKVRCQNPRRIHKGKSLEQESFKRWFDLPEFQHLSDYPGLYM